MQYSLVSDFDVWSEPLIAVSIQITVSWDDAW
jgi:hypothetical protein